MLAYLVLRQAPILAATGGKVAAVVIAVICFVAAALLIRKMAKHKKGETG